MARNEDDRKPYITATGKGSDVSDDEIDEITARIELRLQEQGLDEIKTAVAALNQAVGHLATRQTRTEKMLVLMHKRLQKVEVTDGKVDQALGFLGDLKAMLLVLVRDRGDPGRLV